MYRILRVLTERKKSRDQGKYAEIEPAHYTDDDYERIDAIYESEQARGAEQRYWEDVKVGDELPPMVKGPLTVTEMIAFHAGGYGFVPYGLRSSRVGYKNRKRIAPFYIKNEHGVWDVAQRLHWDSRVGQGDRQPDGLRLRRAAPVLVLPPRRPTGPATTPSSRRWSDSIRKFNYMGDTQFLSGEVVAKRIEGGRSPRRPRSCRWSTSATSRPPTGPQRSSLPSREAGLPPIRPGPRRPGTAGRDHVRPPQRAEGAAAVRPRRRAATMTR